MEGTDQVDEATRRRSERRLSSQPPEVSAAKPETEIEVRRKSLGLLRDITSQWASKESKYTLSDDAIEPETTRAVTIAGNAEESKNPVRPKTPETPSMKPETSSSKPETPSMKPETSSMKPETASMKAETAMPAASVSGEGAESGAKKPETGSLAKRRSSSTPGTIATVPPPPARLKMSSMEEESMRERLRSMLLRQCAQFLEIEGVSTKFTKDSFRRSFLNKELLSRLFQLFDQDRDEMLQQEDWIEFLKERLADEKQMDLAEQLESVAYVLCGDDRVTLDKFCQIFQAKGIVDKLFRLIDKDNDGIVTPAQIMEFLAALTSTRPRSGFDKSNLDWLEQLFRQTVGSEREIRRDDFKKILITKNPFFTDRVFQIFDKDNSGSISMQEFLDAMHQFAGQTPDDKIRFLFKVYDLDGDGLIQRRELQNVMRACMEENGMQFSEEQIDDLTMALFEDADNESRGAITYEALKNQLEKHGGLLENLSISIDRWLVPPKPKPPPASLLGKISALRPYQLTLPYIKNNYVYLIFASLFFIVNFSLFVSRLYEYRHSNFYVMIARACGQCLNFNCMFVLVLMLRHCITFLRTRGFSMFLPLDQHIYFHKLTGFFIFFYSVLHTIMHLLNFGLVVLDDPVLNKDNYSLYQWLFTSEPGLFGLIDGWANPTGVLLATILSIMFICSQTFVRRGGSFEIFYWTHLLYVPFWILLIIHGPNFWKWYIIPGLLYLGERVFRFSLMRSERGKTYISSGLLLPSRVTHLVIKRPPHFDFHPGDYVFVNVPAIAKYEWHPFTISSAPEQEDYMWLHIRGVGEWTNRLHNYFEKEQEKLHNIDQELPTVEPKPTPAAAVATVPEPNTALKRLQEQLKRQFSRKDSGLNVRGKMVMFRDMSGYTNESFSSLPENIRMTASTDSDISTSDAGSNTDIFNAGSGPKKPQPVNLHKLLLTSKTPLEKSFSMPDMENRSKKRDRLLALREYQRSESEKSFDECQMKRARLQSLGLAYLSPQNKSLAQSFRYMRNKPTIIAFKTPSLESCEAKLSALSILSRQSTNFSLESNVEEGRFETEQHKPTSETPHTRPAHINYPVGKPLEIFLDGPYGAPSSHIFRAQHAVLIATGIGVTPFASILQSIMHRYWKARHSCPKCKYTWASDIPPTIMHLRKVDFFWINRDQRSFEWFVNLLSQLEIEQAELGGAMERFLEMHMYITSALQKTDMKAVGLQLALDLLHEKEKRDLITGLKTRTNAGRPNWDKVFKQLLDQKKGKVTVFYCGPPQLGRTLRFKCDQFGFSFRKEVF
nr:PREDICTED: NADPH oxidase 5 [Bemisia tabaci]XP_018898414.1 PREDICTED: NADPH oxidase 5 [Bemisia tabaci]